MGLITASNPNEFKSASFIYSKVRRFLKSFDAANLIDEGEFPTYTKEVLKDLGVGAYMETQAVLPIKDFKTKLPDDFEYLYAAYKCSRMGSGLKGETKHLQNTSFGFQIETDHRTIETHGNCQIECCVNKTVERISVKHYVVESESCDYNNICLLRLSPNVSYDACIGDKSNFLNNSSYEITINNGVLSTNFTDDYVYMKYWALPIDEDGEMLVPNIESVEKAIEWYIIYQFLLSGWFNGTIPDIVNKTQYAESKYTQYHDRAKFENKFPSFAEMVNTIRTKRGINKMVYFTNQYTNTNFQRTR